jgi:hypothetical protein
MSRSVTRKTRKAGARRQPQHDEVTLDCLKALQEENDVYQKENRQLETRLLEDKGKMVDEMNVLTEMVDALKKEGDMLRSMMDVDMLVESPISTTLTNLDCEHCCIICFTSTSLLSGINSPRSHWLVRSNTSTINSILL